MAATHWKSGRVKRPDQHVPRKRVPHRHVPHLMATGHTPPGDADGAVAQHRAIHLPERALRYAPVPELHEADALAWGNLHRECMKTALESAWSMLGSGMGNSWKLQGHLRGKSKEIAWEQHEANTVAWLHLLGDSDKTVHPCQVVPAWEMHQNCAEACRKLCAYSSPPTG